MQGNKYFGELFFNELERLTILGPAASKIRINRRQGKHITAVQEIVVG